MPWPSCQMTLIRSPRRPRKTNRCPSCGSRSASPGPAATGRRSPCAYRCGRSPARRDAARERDHRRSSTSSTRRSASGSTSRFTRTRRPPGAPHRKRWRSEGRGPYPLRRKRRKGLPLVGWGEHQAPTFIIIRYQRGRRAMSKSSHGRVSAQSDAEIAEEITKIVRLAQRALDVPDSPDDDGLDRLCEEVLFGRAENGRRLHGST